MRPGGHDVTLSTNARPVASRRQAAALTGLGRMLCLPPMKARLAFIASVSVLISACSSMHAPKIWPFYKKPKPAPEVVHEVDLVNADGTPASFPQYWKRNTLIIDLSGASGAGSVTAKLPAETTWPVRVAVRVQPGSVQQVEVRGEERSVLPVAAEGTLPIDLEFVPSVFRPTTQAIYINWGSMPQFAEMVVQPEDKFVSPTQVPEKIEPPPEEAAGGANQIISPSDAAPKN
jgi:hypothetical protein